ncbi:MAG TPA: hypothetical protein VJ935_05475 [Acidimicrobiia bacterium]|nr:hypothetical protein [Acidimicrobiia bacterium]
MSAQVNETTSTWSRGRKIAFTVLAAAYGLLLVSPLSVLPYAVLGWLLTGTGTSHRVHEVSFGVVFLISLIGLVAQVRSTPTKVAPMQQVALPILVLIITESLVNGFNPETGTIFLIFGVPPILLAILHPSRREVFKPTPRPSKNLVAMAILLAIPAVLFVVAQITAGVEAAELGAPVFERLDVPLDASPAEFEQAITEIFDDLDIPEEERETIQHSGHWSAMAGFAIGLVVMAFLVAIRVRGFRVTAWSVGLAVAYYGIVSLATPDDASSAGLIGGFSCALWGVAFVALAERDARVTGGQLLTV